MLRFLNPLESTQFHLPFSNLPWTLDARYGRSCLLPILFVFFSLNCATTASKLHLYGMGYHLHIRDIFMSDVSFTLVIRSDMLNFPFGPRQKVRKQNPI